MSWPVPNQVAANHAIRRMGLIMANGQKLADRRFSAHIGLMTQFEQLYQRLDELAHTYQHWYQEQIVTQNHLDTYAHNKDFSSLEIPKRILSYQMRIKQEIATCEQQRDMLQSQVIPWLRTYLQQAQGNVPQTGTAAQIEPLLTEIEQVIEQHGIYPVVQYLLTMARAPLG
jgi:hypothetical protein